MYKDDDDNKISNCEKLKIEYTYIIRSMMQFCIKGLEIFKMHFQDASGNNLYKNNSIYVKKLIKSTV